MKHKKRSKDTRHHIIPSSRGGNGQPRNIARVKRNPHQRYHNLFNNRTPVEIIEYLVDTYWNGDWDYVRQAYEDNVETEESKLVKIIIE